VTTQAADIGSDGSEVVEATHEISVLVWDGPSPARVGAPATATVGVRCSQGCSLAGQAVEVRDASGAVIGRATLGDEPAAGAEALYAAEVTFPAPEATGPAQMTATCTPADLPTRHPDASTDFGFRVDPPADHEVRVRVVFQAAPLAGAEVWMDHYVAQTDPAGKAIFNLPEGSYICSIRKLGFDAEPVAVQVSSDLALEVTAGKGETREELEARLSAWESYPWS
jgi:hypothetical protein